MQITSETPTTTGRFDAVVEADQSRMKIAGMLARLDALEAERAYNEAQAAQMDAEDEWIAAIPTHDVTEDEQAAIDNFDPSDAAMMDKALLQSQPARRAVIKIGGIAI